MRHECTQAMRGVGPESMWLRPYGAARAHPAYRHRYRQQADCRRQVLDDNDNDDVDDDEDDDDGRTKNLREENLHLVDIFGFQTYDKC